MYPISSDVKALFDAEQRQVLRITFDTIKRFENVSLYAGDTLIYRKGNGQDVVLYSGQTEIFDSSSGTQIIQVYSENNLVFSNDDSGVPVHVEITDSEVMMDGFNIDRFCSAGNKLEIGNAIASELSLKIDNRQGQFNSIKFEGVELFVEIGIADWTQDDPTINWIPCGYFTCEDQPRTLSTITIKALDRMLKFDREPIEMRIPWVNEAGVPVEDGRGNIIYFNYSIAPGLTIAQMVRILAAGCEVPFEQDLSAFPNSTYRVTTIPQIQQTLTCRMLLQWCAGIMGTNAWIDWTGALRFSWYDNATDYVTTVANRFQSDLFEDDITITGFTYTNTDNITITLGSADYALDLTGNYLAASGISAILSTLNETLTGFTYRPFEASIINAPYLWPMDVITFNKDDVDHSCVLTNVNFGINNAMSIESKGETAQVNKGIAPSGMTSEQAFIVDKFNASLDQESVFNRLTGNGAAQGLYLYDGNFFLNASYIKGGTIDGESVNAKLFRVVDNDNNTIASFNDTIIIGNTDDVHIGLDYNSFAMYNNKGEKFVDIGDTLDGNGENQITESHDWNGIANTGFFVSKSITRVVSVTLDGMPYGDYRVERTYLGGYYVYLNTAVAGGGTVVIVYITTDSTLHYDLGVRRDNAIQNMGQYSLVEGYDNTASGIYSHAEGYGTRSRSDASHAEGYETNAGGRGGHAEGYNTYCGSWGGHAEGTYTRVTSTMGGHAEGYYTQALSPGADNGVGAHAEGCYSIANYMAAHAEGNYTQASEAGAHAEGDHTVASGWASHAEGYQSKATNDNSHAEGYNTTASGSSCHAEGSGVMASGSDSHAEGYNTIASGWGSHAEGCGTIANKQNTHAFGRYNVPDSSDPSTALYIEIAGNGSETSRSNARTLDYGGNEWIAGTLTQASDERLKDECGEVPDVSSIKARMFKWNDMKLNHDDKEHIGYFAQDVEKVAPYLVNEDAMGYKSLDYIGFLVAKIANLEKRVAELEAKEVRA